jgi:hypothetical protein
MNLSIELPIERETEGANTFEITQVKCGTLLLVENDA